MANEKAVKMAARLYECRDAARIMFGDSYETRMRTQRDFVRAAMARHQVEALPAAMLMIKAAGLTGISAIVLLAAAVDVTDGDGGDNE